MNVHARLVAGALAVAVVLGSYATIRESRASAAPAGHAAVQQVLDRITGADGAPGALAEVRSSAGVTVLTSGVADLRTGARMPGDVNFRIGSMTKPYIATVVLQLAGEHRIKLDAPVERYLPGVVRGNGNDGRRITVRQLLQHTSGLPDYLAYLRPQDILADRYAHHDPIDLLGIALAHPPLFTPGEKGKWSYSNTNYLLAGVLIGKVTGHPYGSEIRHRILEPLELGSTSVPGERFTIPRPHAAATRGPPSAPT